MRLTSILRLTISLAIASGALGLAAQDAGTVQKKLNAEFALTKITADRSDIVSAGAVLVLHKDGLVMYSTPTDTPPLNTYKDGRVQQSAAGNYFRGLGKGLMHGGNATDLANVPQRKFVAGEKFWVTGINIQQDGVVFNVYSDPFNDVRYYGQLKFPFPKNSIPPADGMAKTVEEVITVQPSDDDKAGGDQKDAAPAQSAAAQPATAAPAEPAAPMAPIAPPPPPTDQPPAAPKTISVGQTKDVVVATWGQPTKVVKLASKEIYYYPDMKITFVAGKVSDVQ